MADIANLPRQQSAMTENGMASREWYNYFRRLEDRIGAATGTGGDTTINNGDTTIVNNLFIEPTIQDATTARRLTYGDAFRLIEFTSATAVTVTVPKVSDEFFPDDCIIYLTQGAAGQVTLVADSGVTIDYSDSLKTRTQESTIGIKMIQPDKWQLFGDYEPVAPALSALVRSANSVGAPDFLAASSDGQVLKRESGAIVWGSVPDPLPLDTTLSYNVDDTLDVVTTASGTKTMGYSMGKLVSITGTGAYPSKTFSYTGDLLTGIDVL